ncbi:hypothetical protein Bca52824_043195 [Brassica carinata]|uniref:GAGA-binding transcriptional activator n=1 Tax=Brassica carinata TaxID=52824 RepID=A0A8X7V1S5_BRACI|nr:hypothetical protein Bca52824_043195 [Brassica carinata]
MRGCWLISSALENQCRKLLREGAILPLKKAIEMDPYLSRNHMQPATSTSKDTGLPTSNPHWFHSYFPVPRTTGIDLSQPLKQSLLNLPCCLSKFRIHTRCGAEVVHDAVSFESVEAKTTKQETLCTQNPKEDTEHPETKREKKNPDINVVDISSFDVSGVPPPVCYKWGMGGWQSSCCTISISTFPLPMSTTRPGTRLAGRKMSNGAYVKLLMRLAGEGYDLTFPVDLRNHWARHGTNNKSTHPNC